MKIQNIIVFLLLFLMVCCKPKEIIVQKQAEIIAFSNPEIVDETKKVVTQISDTTFVNLKDYSSDFMYDMKYATTDNFLKAKVYDCAKCYLRLKTIKSLIEANNSFRKMGFKIKLYDCYRPHDVQVKMWQIVPNPKYVANPTKGSIHNKGGAIDITLVDFSGKELDMGTAFDFFGEQASHNFTNLSDTIQSNRKLLKSVMTNSKFNSFDSEWWHYNLAAGLEDKVSNFKWKCE